jgi:hypothetical protein
MLVVFKLALQGYCLRLPTVHHGLHLYNFHSGRTNSRHLLFEEHSLITKAIDLFFLFCAGSAVCQDPFLQASLQPAELLCAVPKLTRVAMNDGI